jgi:phosphoketolase
MNISFEQWSAGQGVIRHDSLTQERMMDLLAELERQGLCSQEQALRLLAAADYLCNMAMWLTVHMTYSKHVYLDGRPLKENDFKDTPEGHTGGALNMVPAYVGYLLANALTGKTRAWMMGQGHCVAAIDAVNILLGNTETEQAQRYPLSDAGLSQLVQDFYSYAVSQEGRPQAPLGSHVNPYTAGGIIEGGYLGFAELQYVHMPLPKQELVAFLSDGAFEEQRGSDWVPRFWRGEDTGLVMPIMIANGRRIDQRTTMSQSGGAYWFKEHLKLNGFEPVQINGRDPAAFAWAIISMAQNLQQQHEDIKQGNSHYPVFLPYCIAETVKGFGFANADTNAAHNLPIAQSPAHDTAARELFNAGCEPLYVPQENLDWAITTLNNHSFSARVKEKDHCLRYPNPPSLVQPTLNMAAVGQKVAPMVAIDRYFSDLVAANPKLRVRVANPDEMRSNRMNLTLDRIKHRVLDVELDVAEAVQGGVITALNEEAVVSAVLANKQGLNIAVSYEAFAVKMLGAMRQEVIFARHLCETNRAPQWLSVPIVVSSHTWENGKNEQSHQDPTLSEAWLGEMSDVAPVLFPCDANTALAQLSHLYEQRGRIATVVAAKNVLPVVCDATQAQQAAEQGAITLSHDHEAQIQLLAIGSYQLQAVQRAAQVLQQNGVLVSVVAIVEPARLRIARDAQESNYVLNDEDLAACIPYVQKRLFVCHTRPEVMTGVLRRLDTGYSQSRFVGYKNRGGTLDVFGMLYANGITWAHLLSYCAELLGVDVRLWLSEPQVLAVNGLIQPDCLR